MKLSSSYWVFLSVAMLTSIAVPVYAESAPVYDADSLQQQFDGGDQQQDVPPPAPSSEGLFVPAQPVIQAPPAPAPLSTKSSDQRIQALEEQLSNLQSGESVAKVDSLQEQVQTMRAQVEELTHQLQQMKAQQKAQYSDLDKRLSPPTTTPTKLSKKDPATTNDTSVADTSTPAATKTATTAVASAPAKASDDQPNVAEEQQIYQTAYNLIKSKKYAEAVSALQGMLKKYPSGQFASNAHYWLGELYGLMGKNDQALTEFNIVVNSYPDSPRVSDAQLKVGLIYATQSKWSDAKSTFKKVVNHFPGSASARLASEQLKQIKLAGH